MARERSRRSWAAGDEAQLAAGSSRKGAYYQVEDPPLIRDREKIIKNLEDITEWAARELRRISDEILVGLEDSICIQSYTAVPSRGVESNIHGGIYQIATAGALSSGAALVVTQGLGKLFVVVNTATVDAGVIKVKGTVVDRNTGAEATGTSTLTLSGVTTDGSTTDANGNPVHSFTRAYITNKWFRDTCTFSTAVADIQDIDVYHISFEQFNDNRDLWLTTFDANLWTRLAAAKFDAYLYSVIPNGSKLDITAEASLNLGTPLPERYYRLRRGNLDKALDGSKDGVFVDVHYANIPPYIEDVTIKVWAAREI